MAHQIVLVPGFLGFASLGGIEYFHGVGPTLKKHCAARGIEATVRVVPTYPTASIRKRAAQVLDTLAQVARESDGPIHVIGHSTGGLDARLAIAPSASLPSEEQLDDYSRIRTLVSVSTPHHGTPLADIVTGAAGQRLLRFMAMMLVFGLRRGQLPLRLALRAGAYVTRLDDVLGLEDTVIDRIYDHLLDDFSEQRSRQIESILAQIAHDQSLLLQLTPAGCDLLNAGTGDPEYARYGCVVSQARPLGVGAFLAHRHDPYAQTLHLWFRLAALGTSRVTEGHLAELDTQARRALRDAYGELPGKTANDGVVPTLSQPWGEVIHAARADHLDVVGHFRGPKRADFFPSASGFDEAAFDALWGDVAAFLAGEPSR